MTASRLPGRPGELIERGREVTFSFDGATRRGMAGDTIASALAATGQTVFSRSFKYHRPRGLFCCSGQCPNCLVEVDGEPGVRACTEPVREGIEVRHMNAWPSLPFDAMRAVDRVGAPLTPPGFYYKTFMRPRRMWPLYERGLRHAAGLGRLPSEPRERRMRADHRTRHADVLVVGAGRAGLRAAIEAAENGADVVLADEGPTLGGRMLWEGAHDEAARIGSAVLRRLVPFEVGLHYTDRHRLPEAVESELDVTFHDDAESMVRVCDVVTINAPLHPETENLFDEDLLSKMKRGAYLVNTARGKICDRDAVARALESGKLAGYAGDVWFPQPAPRDHPWRTMPHHGMTPHVSGTSLSAQARYAAGTREILECWLEGRPIREEYLIVESGALAGAGAHSYSAGDATGGSEEAARFRGG